MCQNIFKNDEEKKRKEDFTRLFAMLVSQGAKVQNTFNNKKKMNAQ